MRHGVVSLLLAATLVSAPVCVAGRASCDDTPSSRCCCGDEPSCPCARSQPDTPAPQPETPRRTAAPEQHALAAPATAVTGTDPGLDAALPRTDLTCSTTAGPSLVVSNCTFRC